ncbi:NTP transferase domain-containing protein [Desulfovibrio sp. OttesenSCG-928-M16]|nr:NTP transferase domain-containing protein [Desulfovibrio sp. OttesenSCG-928-M16]
MSASATLPAALILAAGLSSRMKAPGAKSKALLELHGASLLERATAALQDGGIEDILVVTGHDARDVEQGAARLGLACVHNPDFEQGMFSSVCAGLAALLHEGALTEDRAFFLLPVDAALIYPTSVAALRGAWQSLPVDQRGRACLLPAFAGRYGHPPLLGANLGRALTAYTGRAGVRGYLASLFPAAQRNAFLRGIAPVAQPKGMPGPVAAGHLPFLPQAIADTNANAACFVLHLPDKGLLSDLDQPSDMTVAAQFLDNTRQRQCFAPQEAWEWLRHAGLGREKTRHSIMVGLAAVRLGLALQRRNYKVDLSLHLCGGLLHDIGRGHTRHTELARSWIEAWGMPECALVVGAHTMLPAPVLGRLGISLRDDPKALDGAGLDSQAYESAGPELVRACACVYLADKLFHGDSQVSIARRFERVRARFADDADALRVITRREAIAQAVATRLAEDMADTPDNVVALSGSHALECLCARMLADCPR